MTSMAKSLLVVMTLGLTSTIAQAQSWTKKAAKSVLTVKTFGADGTLIGSSAGFFVSDDGVAVSSFAPFRGAARAVVIDAQGNESAVVCMLGANDTYDLAKFRTDSRKTSALPVGTRAAEGAEVWLLPYREQKQLPQGTVRKAESIADDYVYYTVAIAATEGMETVGCPLLNANGEVIGLMQSAANPNDTLTYAVDVTMATALKITGLSINDKTLRSTTIKKALPDELDQANLTLYVAGASMDSLSYTQLVEEFIAKFPDAPDGYTYRAECEAGAGDFAAAARDMEKAIGKAEKKDEAHFNYARLIYQKEIYHSQQPFADWSLDRAYSEAEEARRTNDEPVYRHLQAQIRYAQQRYGDAADLYATLMNSTLRSADIFYEASRCQAMLRDTTSQLALLDSAVAIFNRPYLKEAAPYILARAQARLDAGRFREAVFDLNDYETLIATGLTERFYYLRHQAEVGGRLFKQALDDIDRAISMKPEEEFYYSEKASLQLRVGLYDEAMATAKECIRLEPDISDGYLFLGLAQCLKGQKDEGLKNLQKAKEKGDGQADALIEKYAK